MAVFLSSFMLSSTQELIAELKAGRMIILADDEGRENEGDLLIAADFVTPEAINFMARFGCGLVCLTLTQERCRQLNLPLMAQNNSARYGTAFTVSIEAAQGISTGISAADRARTVQAAVASNARAEDLAQPGHIFPVMAQPGGVLVRAGHTEAGCDLTSLAGLTPAAVICEVMNPDGTMARLPDLMEFAATHKLKLGTVADLIQYRSQTESIIDRVAQRTLNTPYGSFRTVLYTDRSSNNLHLALIKGEPKPDEETVVRVHEPTSILDCLETNLPVRSWSLAAALQHIAQSPHAGVAVLLNCNSPQNTLMETYIALDNPDKTEQLRHRPIDFKTYGIGAQILRDLHVRKMRILSSPRKLGGLAAYGLEVTEFTPLHGEEN